MKVLYFHQHFSTPAGSTGQRSYEMAQSLLRRGHAVTMVCGSYALARTGLDGLFVAGQRRGVVNGIDVIEFDLAYANADGPLKRVWTFLRFALSSIKLAMSEDYSVLFASTTPLTAGIPGIFARWLRGKPFVFEVRDLWPELPKAMGVIRNPVVLGLMHLLEWATYHSAHRLIGLSPGIVEGIRRKGVSTERVAEVSNGCDLDLFAAADPAWRPANVSENDLMAVFAGSHGTANGLDALIDVAVELKRREREDIKLVLIGDGKLKPALQNRSAEAGLANIVFEHPVGKVRLGGLLASSDVGLQILANVPAFYLGTSPNKFFDYLAAGLPVLINYPGWLGDLVCQRKNGFVVEPDNPGKFADALERAAADREGLRKMGSQSLALAREFDRRDLAERWVDWVEGTVNMVNTTELTKPTNTPHDRLAEARKETK